MNLALRQAYESAALLSLERRHRLDSWLHKQNQQGLEGTPWQIDPAQRELLFKGARPLRIQLAATYDAHSESTLWAWANPSVQDPTLTRASRNIRETALNLSIDEFSRESIGSKELDPIVALAIAADWTDSDSWYPAQHPDGLFLLLIEDNDVAAQPGFVALELIDAFTSIIQSVPLSHSNVLDSWAVRSKLRTNHDSDGVTLTLETGERVVAAFDDKQRCVKLGVKTGRAE